MGNDCFCLCSPCQEQNQSAADIMPELGMQHVEDLIDYIDLLISKIDSGGQGQVTMPVSLAAPITYGRHLIEMLSNRLRRHLFKKCLLSSLDRQTSKVLNLAQPNQFVGMGLSIVAFLLERAGQASSNEDERSSLLCHMSVLAKHMKNLDTHLERCKLGDILRFIVKATVMCALQMEQNCFNRFIFAPLDAADLEKLKSQLMLSYPDLELQALTVLLNNTQNVMDRLPIVPEPSQGEYPHGAAGIEQTQNEIIKLLDLTDSSLRVVVIYGVGGIRKTTLGTAVFNSLNLTGYHYSRVDMDEDCKQSDLPPLQDQILRNAFKENWKSNNFIQGREKMSKAFEKDSNPVFLFIDNALKEENLDRLLPMHHLSRLPIHSRILVTTRNLDETRIFELQDGIQFHAHRVDSLSKPDAKSLLCQYAIGDKNGSFDEGVDIDGLLQFCGGIPLVLGIVGSKLRTGGNTVSACNEILEYHKE